MLNMPNALTVLRIVLLPVIVWRFRVGDLGGALFVYLAAMITDVLDGLIARMLNQVTALGKLLDPLADKLSLVVLLALFARQGQISPLLINLIFVKEMILILGSFAALHLGVVVSALPIGKLTTFVFASSMVFRFLSYQGMSDILLLISVMLSFSSLLWYGIAFIEKVLTQQSSI